jgi:hypothetical protein
MSYPIPSQDIDNVLPEDLEDIIEIMGRISLATQGLTSNRRRI